METDNDDTSVAMEEDEKPPPQPYYPKLPTVEDDDDWMYKMRRTMQEIIPGLFLGPYACATRNSLDFMKAAGLTHVVCIRSEMEAHLIRANHMDHFQYLIVQMNEPPTEPIIPIVKTVCSFIDNCLNAGGKVLVHGNAGMSRSATLVIGYIMWKFGINFRKAMKYVQKKRFCLSVNDTCANQLREFEPIYLAMHAVNVRNISAGPNAAQFHEMKRKIDELVGSDDEEVESDNVRGHRRRLEDAENNGETMEME